MKDFEKIAKQLIDELEKVEIKAYIWHNATTGSVYVRFEDNRIGSVRIGDHDGREKLKYKFNIRSDIKRSGYWLKDNNIWRYFVRANSWKDIIPVIVERQKSVKEWKTQKYTYNVPKFKRKEAGDSTVS